MIEGAFALLLLAGGLVVVDADGDCPAPARVAEALAPLLPEGRSVAAPDRARLRQVDGGLEVELLSADGKRLALRRMQAEAASCDDLAGGAAVVIATWEAELHPGLTAAPIEFSRRDPVPQPLAWEVGAGFSASYDLVAPTGSFAMEASVGRPRLAARLGVELQMVAREAAAGSGRVSWSRHALSLGIRYRIPARRFRVDLHGSVLAALLVISGRGFQIVREERDIDPGIAIGARLLLPFGRVAPWLDLSGTVWLREQVAVAQGRDALSLPRGEGRLSLGVCYGTHTSF